MSKILDWPGQESKVQDWPTGGDEFDKATKAGTNTLGQIASGVGSRVVDFLAGPLDRVLKVTDAAAGGSGKTVEKAGDLGVQIGDMTIGWVADIPAKIRGGQARIAASPYGVAAADAAGDAAEDLGPWFNWAKAPFSALKELATGKPSEEVIPMSKIIDDLANGLEERTDGLVSASGAKFALGALFDVGGYAAVRTGAIKMAERASLAKWNKFLEEKAAAERATNEAKAARQPKNAAKVGPQVPDDFVSPRDVRRGVEDQKARGAAGKLDAQERWLDEQGYVPSELERPTEAAPKTGRLEGGEPLVGREAAEAPPVNASLESAQAKVREGRLFDMTAAERVALRGAGEQQGMLVGPEGQPARGRYNPGEAGAANPELLAYLAAGGTAAAWIANHPDDAQLLGGGGLLGAGAIKPKGGAWHWKAVEGLAEPIVGRATGYNMQAIADNIRDGNELTPGTKEIYDWSQRSIKNYLNKHAGTATDPLKDVEIPFGEGTKRWEELTDKAFAEHKVTDEYVPQGPGLFMHKDDLPGAKLGESVYGEHPLKGKKEQDAVKSYLSHVGDYLREHVPADKLPQYDLVRAVKETQKWDAELAKNMAKARLAEKGASPIYREYPDGMYWQQLTKPGQFARESDAMGHSVRGYEPHKGIVEIPDTFQVRGRPELNRHPDWTDASGDSGRPSYGLGGWEAIKQNFARIYSLRDKAGNSHATIEVKGETPESVINERAGTKIKAMPAEIVQIKGKQNRAPDAKYLPYIQDFVKGEKWGEVGDLENAGMVHGKVLQSFHPDDVAKFTPAAHEIMNRVKAGEQYIPRAEWEKAFDSTDTPDGGTEYIIGNRRERGSVDPKLLTGIAAIGGGAAAGAALGEDLKSTILGGLAGGLVGTRGGREAAKALVRTLENWAGTQSTAVRDISPPVARAVRDLKMNTMKRVQDTHVEVAPFVEAVGKLPEKVRDGVRNALLNSNWEALSTLPGIRELAPAVQKALADVGTELKSLHRFAEGLTDYFPRRVKDFEGLKNALGQPFREGIEKVLADATAKLDRPLTELEQSVIIDRYMKAPENASQLPGYAKSRRVGEVTPELQRFYETPEKQLLTYFAEAINDIETAKFFGKDLVQKTQGGKKFIDVDQSIGKVLQREVGNKDLTSKQVNELRDQLRVLFVGGETAPKEWLQHTRNVSNLGLLAQIGSTVTQLGDLAMVPFLQGLPNVLTSVVQQAQGKTKMTRADLGLVNNVMEELGNTKWSGKALQAGLKYTGFRALDQLALATNVNAAFVKNQRMVSTPKGEARFAKEWGDYYGADTPQLIAELKAGEKTPLTRSLMFSEMSDVRPASNFEMPKAYNEHPDGRLLWQLKSYMVKQADIIRNRAYKKIVYGDAAEKAQGLKNLAVLGAGYAVANVPADAIKAMISGQEYEITAPEMVDNFFQTFGVNRYAADQLREGKLKRVAQDAVTPAVVGQAADILTRNDRMWKNIPGAGRQIYDWFLGGNERKEISKQNREIKDVREELGLKRGEPTPQERIKPLSPEAQKLKDSYSKKIDAAPEEMQGIKSVRGIAAREEYRMQEREDLLRGAEKKLKRRLTRDELMDFLAAEEQAEIRRALPRRRQRETM